MGNCEYSQEEQASEIKGEKNISRGGALLKSGAIIVSLKDSKCWLYRHCRSFPCSENCENCMQSYAQNKRGHAIRLLASIGHVNGGGAALNLRRLRFLRNEAGATLCPTLRNLLRIETPRAAVVNRRGGAGQAVVTRCDAVSLAVFDVAIAKQEVGAIAEVKDII